MLNGGGPAPLRDWAKRDAPLLAARIPASDAGPPCSDSAGPGREQFLGRTARRNPLPMLGYFTISWTQPALHLLFRNSTAAALEKRNGRRDPLRYVRTLLTGSGAFFLPSYVGSTALSQHSTLGGSHPPAQTWVSHAAIVYPIYMM